MKRSSCSSFTERFQKFLRADRSRKLVYDFEGADVTVGDARKEKGRGCDYAMMIRNGGNCEMVLIECKGGELNLGDFKDAKEQLEYSVDFVKTAFDDVPDLAVICYERSSAIVSDIILRRNLLNERLRHGVRLILMQVKDERDAYCRICR